MTTWQYTTAQFVTRGLGDDFGVFAEAGRIGETADEVRDGEAEDFLLVGHRSGAIDHEEEIDFVDAGLAEAGGDDFGGSGVLGLEGTRETGRAEDERVRKIPVMIVPVHDQPAAPDQ